MREYFGFGAECFFPSVTSPAPAASMLRKDSASHFPASLTNITNKMVSLQADDIAFTKSNKVSLRHVITRRRGPASCLEFSRSARKEASES